MLVASIGLLVPDARNGLPEDLFLLVSRLTPMVNVDLLITDEDGRKLLIWRHDNFYGPGWHIPGGIVRFKETMANRVSLVALKEVGCDVTIVGDCLQVTEIQSCERDVRGHFVSHLFRCKLAGIPDAGRRASPTTPQHGQWQWFSTTPPDLIPQHRRFSGHIESLSL